MSRAGGGPRVTCSAALVCAAVLVLTAATSVSMSSSRAVSLRTEDGVTIAGTFYEAARRPAPAVVLLPMLARSRDDWQAFAIRLADAGIHALAIDFRGQGPSPPGETDLARLVLDVEAARVFLGTRPDLVRPSAIGIAGASVGASLALIEAASDTAVKSLALLSPSLNYRSLRADPAMRKYGDRPALLVAATNDPYAVRSVKQLATLGGGVREVKTLENAGHGMAMLTRDPDLARALVDWFERTLL